jgi:hypothetical protein
MVRRKKHRSIILKPPLDGKCLQVMSVISVLKRVKREGIDEDSHSASTPCLINPSSTVVGIFLA